MLEGLLIYAGNEFTLVSKTDNTVNRRAVEIFESQSDSGIHVEMKHVDKAVREMLATPSIQAIQRCSFQQRVFLVAIVRQVRSSGCAEVEFGHVIFIQDW